VGDGVTQSSRLVSGQKGVEHKHKKKKIENLNRRRYAERDSLDKTLA
jgi:hypothetical protein